MHNQQMDDLDLDDLEIDMVCLMCSRPQRWHLIFDQADQQNQFQNFEEAAGLGLRVNFPF